MSKRLRAIVKECRTHLEQDIQRGQASSDHLQIVRETALTWLLELAVLRCLEEQRWRVPSQLSGSLTQNDLLPLLTASRQYLQPELGFFFQWPEPVSVALSDATLKTVLHHLTETISAEEWRAENILGWLYHYFHDETEEQKQQGRFYTPETIADFIVSQAFEYRQNSAFTILDLGCGSGIFALRAFEQLYLWYQSEDANGVPQNLAARILEEQLFLVDNDPWACRIAALNLYLKAKRLDPVCRIRKMNIFCEDALNKECQSSALAAKALLWHSSRYDLVVGNPPYIVINQLRAPKEIVRLYKTYASAAFKINTFPMFIERGIELLKPDGILGMIVPNTLFTQMYFEPLRRYILQNSRILRILDTKRLFDNAFVENCILLLQRETNAVKRSENLIECVTPSSNGNGQRKRGDIPGSNITRHVAQRHFEHAPFMMFRVHLDEQLFALIEKIARGNPKLGDICETHDGVNPGNAKPKLIVSEKFDAQCKPVLNGKNIGRYWLKWGGLYVRYDKQLLTKGDNVRWGHRPSLNAPKILSRQTADRIIAAFDDGDYYTTNSIHTTILKEGSREFQLKYLLGLFNSKLLSFYYRKLFPEHGQLFSQVKLVNLRQLPVKEASPDDQQVVIRLVERLLQDGCRTDDALLDQRVYDLYELTPDEIGRIEHEMRLRIVDEVTSPNVSLRGFAKQSRRDCFVQNGEVISSTILT